jgi:hypothetical protein
VCFFKIEEYAKHETDRNHRLLCGLSATLLQSVMSQKLEFFIPTAVITSNPKTETKLNSVVCVLERTIPERPPIFGEVSANFCG